MVSVSNRSRGGHARAAKLTPERRVEIGKTAAAARWAKPHPRARGPGQLALTRRRLKAVEAVLIELVLLKQIHDEVEAELKTHTCVLLDSRQYSYRERKPKAWAAAFEIVKELGYVR